MPGNSPTGLLPTGPPPGTTAAPGQPGAAGRRPQHTTQNGGSPGTWVDQAPAARRTRASPVTTAQPPGRWRHRAWFRAISPLVFLVAWQLVSASGLVSQQKLPPPSTCSTPRSP